MNQIEALSRFTLQDFKLITDYESFLKEEYSTDSLALRYYQEDYSDKIFCSVCGASGVELGRVYLFP